MSMFHVLVVITFSLTSGANLRTRQDLAHENRLNATSTNDQQLAELKEEVMRLERAQVANAKVQLASAQEENELKIRVQRDEEENTLLRTQTAKEESDLMMRVQRTEQENA